ASERPSLRRAVRGGSRRGARSGIRARRARAVRSRGSLRNARGAAGLHRSRALRPLGDRGGEHRMNRTGTPWTSLLGAVALTALVLAPAGAGGADQAADSATAIARIMETFARPPVDSGAAVGIAVGVTYRGRPLQFFSYG